MAGNQGSFWLQSFVRLQDNKLLRSRDFGDLLSCLEGEHFTESSVENVLIAEKDKCWYHEVQLTSQYCSAHLVVESGECPGSVKHNSFNSVSHRLVFKQGGLMNINEVIMNLIIAVFG